LFPLGFITHPVAPG